MVVMHFRLQKSTMKNRSCTKSRLRTADEATAQTTDAEDETGSWMELFCGLKGMLGLGVGCGIQRLPKLPEPAFG
jgi:hypothetical protein